MAFQLPQLAFAYNALEPHMDALTVETHHSKHHAGYTKNFNNAIKGTPLENKTAEEIFAHASKHPAAVVNNGGGYYNHKLFWEIIAPNAGGNPAGELAKAIDANFGSFSKFKEQFAKAAATQFGSGWAWLVKQGDKLVISSTQNQINPLMDLAEVKGTPILTIDVWEHAYYLKFQNRRPDFIENFWKLINWDAVAQKFNA